MNRYHNALFLFRRDLRLEDNTALAMASQNSSKVHLAFHFHPLQNKENPYFSPKGFEFLEEALKELDSALSIQGAPLNRIHGELSEDLQSFIKAHSIEAIFSNKDSTPFAKKRDEQLSNFCHSLGVHHHLWDDYYLNPPGEVLKTDNQPYQIFTPYWKKASLFPNLQTQKVFPNSFACSHPPQKHKPTLSGEKGPRARALRALKNLHNLKEYSSQRDIPALDSTSHLSEHLKFGTVSCREVHLAIQNQFPGEDHPLLRQLHWRDFFSQIAHHYPHVFGKPFHRKYDSLPWSKNKAHFKKWCEGTTGFPIIDAAMRELNATGYMHNRCRMLTASFLTKDLHINWRWGEQYFARKLRDYDPAINNGNWQWAASTGCDAQPYFRIFNPWTQQKKWDPEATYIQRWIPELSEIAPKLIHKAYELTLSKKYPLPMVNHSEEAKKTKERFQRNSGSVY